MRRASVLSSLFVLLFAFRPIPAAAQGTGEIVVGTVTDRGEPLPNVQVVMTNLGTGRQYKTKTDKEGKYYFGGIAYAVNYQLQVLGPKGDILYSQDGIAISTERETKDVAVTASPGSGTMSSAAPKLTKEQQKAEAAKMAKLNEFITQYQTAVQAQNMAGAEKALQGLLAADPETTRWEFYKALGDVQSRNNEPEAAIQTFDKGIALAQSIVSGKAVKDPRSPDPKAGIGQMLTSEGNAYLKLGRADQANAVLQQATQAEPNPAVAYYNLCAVSFNAGKLDEAVAECDKSIQADPSRADAWFVKGAALQKSGKPGAADALNKYLQLAPTGGHASEAKQMLQGAK